MRILISNDDGVYAPGIAALATELQKIAEVTVVAPDRDRSGASNSLSISVPIRLQPLPQGYISVSGTPTDCVHVALTGLMKDKFDMVVSGINSGANLGDDVLYSGTVAAAIEGRMLGMPALAISLVSKGPAQHFDTAAIVARNLVEHIELVPLPVATILNVNIPDVPLTELRGIEVTRLGTRHIGAPAIEALDPRGATVYWIGPSGSEQDAGPGTDFYAVNSSKISITPLKVDMTNYTAFENISHWVSHLVLKN